MVAAGCSHTPTMVAAGCAMPRILVVDDDRETCRFMEELLRGPDRQIELAHTP